MKVAILGSGIHGVSSAWWISQSGISKEIVVIDRLSKSALDTSFANGGQISVSYAEPWANFSNLLISLKWILRKRSPITFRPNLDVNQWKWFLYFIKECMPHNVIRNMEYMINLAKYSRDVLKNVRDELHIEYDYLDKGILSFYTNQNEFKKAQKTADIMQKMGVHRKSLSVDEIINIEPALSSIKDSLVGGYFTEDDESGDARKFTQSLADLCSERSVQFKYNHNINRLIYNNGRITSVELVDQDGYFKNIDADIFVVTLGSYSPILLKPLGIKLNIYPAKGYSATFPVIDKEKAPYVSLIDNADKLVFSRLGDRMRIAGSVDFSGYSRSLNNIDCNFLLEKAMEMFPNSLDFENVSYWSGLRPATPSNVPIIGKTKIDNLYINSGHGPLGWTMGMGSGKALSDIVNGKKPNFKFPFLGI
ncbi:MAG: D-amino acid dehydrogenase [Candidatus Kinetoplastibacterium crithidii]|nr:MAG: D-amino acid dehydrogenase [Candidatus Kinetoplastibacterium crithidii]